MHGAMLNGKKALAVLAVMSAFAIPAAHALDVTALLVAIPIASGEYVTAGILAPTATTEGAYDNRAVYYQVLRDDAAQEVAADGAPTAVLEDAIRQVRAQTGTTLDNRAIAIQILKALN